MPSKEFDFRFDIGAFERQVYIVDTLVDEKHSADGSILGA